MSNFGKRMVRESKIKEIGQGGADYTAGTGIDITEDVISADFNEVQEKLTAGDNITIEDGVISSTGGAGAKTYGLTIEELNTKYGKGTNMQQYSLSQIVAAGLPILGTTIANQSPYTSQLITVDKGDANEIILKDLFGVVRYEDGQYVVHVCRTNTSGTNAANEFYAYRIGDNDWIIKGARWANERNLFPDTETQYTVYDITDMNTFFQVLVDNYYGEFYYYDTTGDTYVQVEFEDSYDSSLTYYLFDGSSYNVQPITPEAYFNWSVGVAEMTLYIKVGDNYVEATEYDAAQTYYEREEVIVGQGKAEMLVSTGGSNIGVSSDSTKNLVHIEQVNIQLDSPVMNVRYDNQVKVPTSEGSYVLGVSVNGSGNPTLAWGAPTVPSNFSANEANILTVNTEGVYFYDGDDSVMNIHSGSNVNIFYAVNSTKPFEISTYAGSWIRFNTDGSVSMTTVDSNTSTAHLYEFKADGIYLDNVKITS